MATQLNITREEFHLQVNLLRATHSHEELQALYAKIRYRIPWEVNHARLHAAWYLGHKERHRKCAYLGDDAVVDWVANANDYIFSGEGHECDLGNG